MRFLTMKRSRRYIWAKGSDSDIVRGRFQQKVALRNRMVPLAGQSMQLLQMSTLELSATINQELESNPLLEIEDVQDEQEPLENQQEDDPADDGNTRDEVDQEIWDKQEAEAFLPPESHDEGVLKNLDPDESIEGEIEWDDRLDHLNPTPNSEENPLSRIENRARSQTLIEHLLEQLLLTGCSDREKRIAVVIFDELNEDGYIETTTETLIEDIRRHTECSKEELEDVLAIVQDFSPLGICARDPQECLIIQVRACDPKQTQTRDAMLILKEYFEQLAEGRLHDIEKLSGLDTKRVEQAVLLIKGLNPRPASSFSHTHVEYIEPEARVIEIDGEWVVEREISNLPSLRISSWYDSYRASISMAAKESNAPQARGDREYIKEHYARAKLFIAGVQFRQLNVMRIIEVIVKWQQDYFNKGAAAMKPLILADVAGELDLHASTVSRLTTNKYLQTPHGTLELKHFFTNRVGNQPGREHSGVAIRAMMKEVIEEEDRSQPLSDQKIADLLHQRRVDISRRTVTKYRESMSIPSRRERREIPSI